MDGPLPIDSGEPAELKRRAAERAVEWVESGMVVGLGSGTTAIFAVRRIGALLGSKALRDIVAVPTSSVVEAEARRLNIPLTSPDDPPPIDVVIDGADEVDPDLNLIKGGGGALLREKIVAQLSRRRVIVVDETKLSPKLGASRPLPVEVVTFAWQAHARHLESLGASVALRRNADGGAFTTDQGNYIVDCAFGPIDDPHALALKLLEHAGVVEHGLFLDLATDVIVATTGGLRHLRRP